MQIYFKRILLRFLVVLLIFSVTFAIPRSAEAIVSKQQETPEQTLYQSRHTLQDNLNNSWQVVLFKRLKNGKTNQIELRLVGFPGKVEFTHPQELEIITDGQAFQASDRFSESAPGLNVGQFDLKEILPQLVTEQTITLKLPLNNQQSSTIQVPFPVMLEWQEIAKS